MVLLSVLQFTEIDFRCTVQHLEELVQLSVLIVADVPHGRAEVVRLVHALLRTVVDDRNPLGEHQPSKGVVLARLGLDARVANARLVIVIVNEVAQQALVLVQACLVLLLHGLSKPRQIEVRPWPSLLVAALDVVAAAEGGSSDHAQWEVEHTLQDKQLVQALEAVGARQAHVLRVEGLLRRRHLAQDLHVDPVLQVLQEGGGHKGRRVQPDGVDVVGLDHPDGPVDQRLAHLGVRLVEVAQGVEPAVEDLLLIVAWALVPDAAEGQVVGHGVAQALGERHRGGAVIQEHVRRLAQALRVVVEAVAGLLAQLVEVLRLVERVHLGHVGRGEQGADMVDDHVQHEAHVPGVQLFGELLEVRLGAVVRVDIVEVVRPVAHEAGAVVGRVQALELLHRGRDPDAVEAHALDVVELADDALEGAAAPLVLPLARRRVAVGLREAVEEEEVDALTAQRELRIVARGDPLVLPVRVRGHLLLVVGVRAAVVEGVHLGVAPDAGGGQVRLQRLPLQRAQGAGGLVVPWDALVVQGQGVLGGGGRLRQHRGVDRRGGMEGGERRQEERFHRCARRRRAALS
mmetsp:Transcript_82714/g.213126  ORF Transcript_82714/g.213126 Transcript_82714/m.213126 type:complete len:573 (+) Transcript_82714:991-2709(+)